jgi:cytochrome c oxidase assembly protein subunit 11
MPKRYIVAAFLCVLAVMIGLTSYSVTLYRLFCQVTGNGGTTQRVATNNTHERARMVTVFFDTSVAPGMPWKFTPVQRSVKVHLGEDAMAFFEAQNVSDHDIVGHATFNVTPDKIGIYFKKIQCFCFNEERLKAGQRVQMPVTFFVDPRLADDPSTNDVHEITLSYTFFQSSSRVSRRRRPMRRRGPACSPRSAPAAMRSTATRSGPIWATSSGAKRAVSPATRIRPH